ncbi:MAG: NAD(P)H-dependent oxidoreductase [Clostridia bacterium]|nr:NAD(P)H-dependent oxidoreductase [Clostridia bacterium]
MKKVKIIIICLIALVVIGGLAFVIIKNINTEDKQTLDVSITDEQGKEAELNLNSDKILVIYFSETGNTQKLAKLISDKVGGDFVRIETEKVYPEDYDELVDDAKKEKDNNDRPKLKELNINLENYDTIFVGYPIWWYQMPMAMYTFFDNYDFANKTIIPFNTHEGSGSSGTYEDIQKLEPKAKVLEGLPIRGGDMTSDQSNKVDNWLKNLDI